MRSLTLVVLTAFSTASVLAQTQAGAPQPSPSAAAEQWSVTLPATPVAVFAHKSDLWVCGWEEMIAVSHDRGRTWQVQHRDKGGEILYALTFATDRVAHAVGTLGTLLKSTDGGVRWDQVRTPVATSMASGILRFGDERNGIIGEPYGFEWTSSGGLQWIAKGFSSPQKSSAGRLRLLAAAMLDGQHAAVLFRPSPSRPGNADTAERVIAATTDGGNTWETATLKSVKFNQLVSRRGEYWLYGQTLIEHSRDGLSWQTGPPEAHAFNRCTAEGCFVDGEQWVDLTASEPRV